MMYGQVNKLPEHQVKWLSSCSGDWKSPFLRLHRSISLYYSPSITTKYSEQFQPRIKWCQICSAPCSENFAKWLSSCRGDWKSPFLRLHRSISYHPPEVNILFKFSPTVRRVRSHEKHKGVPAVKESIHCICPFTGLFIWLLLINSSVEVHLS
jgi:hypothetical protein